MFLNTFLNAKGILTNFALLSLFVLTTIFILNYKIGLFILIILRVGLDYFREWDIFTVKDYFTLNFGAVLGIFILVFTLCWIIAKTKEIFKTPNILIIFLFLFISLISILYSQNQFAALEELVRICSFFAIYFLTFNLIKTKYDLQLARKIFLVSAIIPFFFGLWQIIAKTGLADESGFLRIYGSFAHPNAFSYFLVIILTLLIYFFITEENQKTKILYLLFIILNFILLVFTYSRGAWLAFATILLLLGILKYRKLLFKSLITIILFIILIVSVDLFFPNYNSSYFLNFNPSRRIIESFSLNHNSSISWRIELWQEMADVFWKKPFLGHGIGSFEQECLKATGFYTGSYEAHNDYLRLAIELGLIGLTIYVLLILIILKNIIKI
ncbi:O-antigen ligase family protein, partial [Patescibacteria group bacterium]|nr:O-antigen ligase family protein [Patescibacteria group bacterium]MBU1933771.1 O-antigen ligase family protein [Patescibacteria group bacterium]